MLKEENSTISKCSLTVSPFACIPTTVLKYHPFRRRIQSWKSNRVILYRCIIQEMFATKIIRKITTLEMKRCHPKIVDFHLGRTAIRPLILTSDGVQKKTGTMVPIFFIGSETIQQNELQTWRERQVHTEITKSYWLSLGLRQRQKGLRRKNLSACRLRARCFRGTRVWRKG